MHTPLFGFPGGPVSRVFEVGGVVRERSHQNLHEFGEPGAQHLIRFKIGGKFQLEAGIEGTADDLLEVVGLNGVDGSSVAQKVVNEGEGLLDQLIQTGSGGTTIPLSFLDNGAVTKKSSLQHPRVLLGFENLQDARDELGPLLRPIRADDGLDGFSELCGHLRMAMKKGVDSILTNDGFVLGRNLMDGAVMGGPVGVNGLLEDNGGEGSSWGGDVVTEDDLEHQHAEARLGFGFF
mmetsp:Transcript_35716/g.55797  ORF Transcript_35716/g.55797 Transcript_35716/m.55797 type:complete len:235 (-) Transcript_35716:112-816(-)